MLEILLSLLVATGSGPAEASVGDSVRYGIRLGNAPVGRCLWVTSSDSAGFVYRREENRIEIRRGDQEIILTEEALWTEEPGGDLRSVHLIRSGLGPDSWSDLLVCVQGGWRRERTRAGRTEVDTLPGGPLHGPVAIERLLSDCRDSSRVRSVNTEAMRPATFRVVRLRGDTLEAGANRIACVVFTVRDSALGGPATANVLQWRDRRGAIWMERDEGLGSVIERDEIARGEASEIGFDAIAWRPLPFEGDPPNTSPCEILMLPEPPSADELAAGVAPPIPDEPGQRVTGGASPQSWRIRLERGRAGETTNEDRARWRDRADLAPCIESDLIVDAADPAVRDFAQGAVLGAETPTEEALLLERAVHERIVIRDLGTVFATASQTLRARRGDCTEHAVLLAACCRARGIPARLVAGIVPASDRMLFHLWTEVFLNRWSPLDATLGIGGAAPCAIALVRWEHLEEGVVAFSQPFERIAGHYRFRLEDAER